MARCCALQIVSMTVMLPNGTVTEVSPQKDLHVWRAFQVIKGCNCSCNLRDPANLLFLRAGQPSRLGHSCEPLMPEVVLVTGIYLSVHDSSTIYALQIRHLNLLKQYKTIIYDEY